MENPESSHRCLIRSSNLENQQSSSRASPPPKSDFISVSCPDMTYHMPALAAHPSLPDRLCTENVFQAHLKRNRPAGLSNPVSFPLFSSFLLEKGTGTFWRKTILSVSRKHAHLSVEELTCYWVVCFKKDGNFNLYAINNMYLPSGWLSGLVL